MKVCHQAISHFKFKTRVNEDIGFALPRRDLTCGLCGALNEPEGCCSHRNYASTCRFGGGNLGSRLWCDLAPFCVHFMSCDVFDLHGQERTCTDM